MTKRKKSEKMKYQIPPHRWEGIDDDAEEEGTDPGFQSSDLAGERAAAEDRAANFNPFDEDKFEADNS